MINPELTPQYLLRNYSHFPLSTVLYGTVLYCTVLYCIVRYCTVLYCTVLYCTVRYCTIMYCTVLYYTYLCESMGWGNRWRREYSTQYSLELPPLLTPYTAFLLLPYLTSMYSNLSTCATHFLNKTKFSASTSIYKADVFICSYNTHCAREYSGRFLC